MLLHGTVLSIRSVADATLGILIEDVDTGCIDSNLDLIAAASLRTGRNSCNDILAGGCILHAFEAKVQIDLSTHKLGNVNINIKNIIGHT